MPGRAAVLGALGAAVALGACTAGGVGAAGGPGPPAAGQPTRSPEPALAPQAAPSPQTTLVSEEALTPRPGRTSAVSSPDGAGPDGAGQASPEPLTVPERVRGELARYTVVVDATGKRTSAGVVLVNSAAVPGRRYVVEAGCSAVEAGQQASFGIVSYSDQRTRQPAVRASIPCDGRGHLFEHRPDGSGRVDVVPGPEVDDLTGFFAVVRPARPGEPAAPSMTSTPVPDLRPPLAAPDELVRVTGESGPTAAQVVRDQRYVVTAACTGDRPGVSARWHLDAAEAADIDDQGDGSVASGSVDCTGTAQTTVRTLAVSGTVVLDVDRVVNGYATQYWVTVTPAG